MIKIEFQVILECLLFILLFFSVFVLRSFNLVTVFISVLGFFILIATLIHYKKPIKQRDKILYYIIVGGSLLSQGILYLFGLFNGFSNNYSVFYKNYLPKLSIIMFIGLILVVEAIRYLLMSNLKNQKKDFKSIIARIIMILNYIIIDYIITGQSCNFKSNYEIFNLLMIFVIPTATKHIFLDYVSYKYGHIGTYWYRLIMDMYIYVVPFTPKVNPLIETVFIAALPYLMYIAIESILNKNKKETRRDRRNKKRVSLISLTIFVILVYLVSCQFTYCMIAIGSESMTGTINKGDAVIYKRYNKEKLEVGDIIAFRHNNVVVVHRIHSKVNTHGDTEAYITKGDANKSEDNWIVTKENIVGVVKVRVMLIAWPSVLLNEWL